MKKLLYLMLIAALTLTLWGCDSEKTQTPEETASTAQTAETTEPTTPAAELTKEEQDAVDHVLALLEVTPLSREAVMGQLVYDGYSETVAAVAVDNCGVDWKEQALRSAKEYVQYLPISEVCVEEMLAYDRFTAEEVSYAMENLTDVDWDAEADEYVKGLLKRGVSASGLKESMEDYGFTTAQINGAVAKTSDVDWDAQAVLCAKGYLEAMEFTRDTLISQLKYEGFTTGQAEYAADACGF